MHLLHEHSNAVSVARCLLVRCEDLPNKALLLMADLRAVVLPLMEKVAAMEAEIMQLRSLLASKCNTTD